MYIFIISQEKNEGNTGRITYESQGVILIFGWQLTHLVTVWWLFVLEISWDFEVRNLQRLGSFLAFFLFGFKQFCSQAEEIDGNCTVVAGATLEKTMSPELEDN